jgi:hypothetical protein
VIKEISFTNIKNRSGKHQLAPVTLIVGDNRAGKTAVCEALDLGMIGRSIKCGKQNADIFRLASGQTMSVELSTGTASNSFSLSQNGDKVTRKESYGIEFPEVLRDSALYFSKSDAARVAMVASLVKVSENQAFSVPELLGGVKNIKLEENTEASEKAILESYNALSTLKAKEPLEWVAAAIDATKESLKRATATQKTMTGVTVGITVLQSQDADQAATATQSEGKLKAARVQLGQAQAEAGKWSEKQKQAQQDKATRDKLVAVVKPNFDEHAIIDAGKVIATNIDAAKSLVASRTPTADQAVAVSQLQGQISALRKEHSGFTAEIGVHSQTTKPDDVNEGALLGRAAALNQSVVALKRMVSERKISTDTMAATIEGLKAERNKLAGVYSGQKTDLTRLQKELADFMACETCPTCMATGTAWKDAWKQQHDEKITAVEVALSETTEKGNNARVDIDRLEAALAKDRLQDLEIVNFEKDSADISATLTAYGQQKRTWENAQKQIAILKEKCAALSAGISDSVVAIAEAEIYLALYRSQDSALDQLAAQRDKNAADLETARTALKEWNEAQAKLQSFPEPDVDVVVAAKAMADVAVQIVQEEIARLEQQQKQVALARADLKRQIDAAKAAEVAGAQVAVLKATKDILEDKQAKLVESCFTPLLGVVNQFTSAIIPHPIVYELDKGLGYRDGGMFVSAASFSGAEELVTFMGLSVALAAVAKEKVVVLDECTRLIGKSKEKVLRRLVKLVAEGVIHQAIMVDGSTVEYGPIDGGVEVIKV